MQVLVFAGESYYPLRHLQDLVGVSAKIPSYDEIVRIIQRLTVGEDRLEHLSLGRIDWISLLIMEEGKPPRRQAFDVLHTRNSRELHEQRCFRIWTGDDAKWHGLRDAEDLRTFTILDV